MKIKRQVHGCSWFTLRSAHSYALALVVQTSASAGVNILCRTCQTAVFTFTSSFLVTGERKKFSACFDLLMSRKCLRRNDVLLISRYVYITCLSCRRIYVAMKYFYGNSIGREIYSIPRYRFC